jgi:hypothetical protein
VQGYASCLNVWAGRYSNRQALAAPSAWLSLHTQSVVNLIEAVQVPIVAEAQLAAALAVTPEGVVCMHFASSPLWLLLSPASLWHVIDTCLGAPR